MGETGGRMAVVDGVVGGRVMGGGARGGGGGAEDGGKVRGARRGWRPIPGSYTLEVSSPGLDRRLRTIEHFERYVGQRVKVQTKMPVSGRKRFTGELAGIEDGEICLDVDGQKHRVQLTDIHSARLVPGLNS